MKKTFIEARVFTARYRYFMDEEDYRELQNTLMADPDKGAVMPGCGGLRKLRWAAARRGKGKRGGCRVIYVHVPAGDCVYLLTIYGKDEQDDLTAEQRKRLKALAELGVAEVLQRYQHRREMQK